MATYTKTKVTNEISHSAPYGNAWVKRFVLAADSNGKVIDLDTDGVALAAGDVVRIGWLPGGIELHDVMAIVSVPPAGGGVKVGIEYEDGEDSEVLPQQDDYFFTALDLDTAAIVRATDVMPPAVLPKNAYVTLTVGAPPAASSRADIIVKGLNVGYA